VKIKNNISLITGGAYMIVSNKSLIIATLTLGINQFGLASCVHTLNHTTTQILNFTQTLRQVNHKDNKKIAQWLEQQVKVWNKSYNACDHNYDISAIANILNDNKLDMPSKISMLSQVMANQQQRNSIIGTIRNSLSFGWSMITGNSTL
jgi:hypothetical protein